MCSNVKLLPVVWRFNLVLRGRSVPHTERATIPNRRLGSQNLHTIELGQIPPSGLATAAIATLRIRIDRQPVAFVRAASP